MREEATYLGDGLEAPEFASLKLLAAGAKAAANLGMKGADLLRSVGAAPQAAKGKGQTSAKVIQIHATCVQALATQQDASRDPLEVRDYVESESLTRHFPLHEVVVHVLPPLEEPPAAAAAAPPAADYFAARYRGLRAAQQAGLA